MTPFSASDAALEGFQLVRRRWRVALGWAGFNLLALVMVIVLSAMLSVILSAVGGGSGGNTPAMAVAGLLVLGAALFTQAIIAVGVLRLELRPDEPAFLHLRLGRDELRLVLVWLIGITGAWVLGWAGTLVGHAAGAPRGLGEFLAVLVVVYLGLRFVLVPPIAYAERKIDFPRSWVLTRGRALAVLGMTALSICLIALVMIAALVALALAALAIGGFSGLAGVFGGAEAFRAHPAIFLLAFVAEIVLTPVLWILAMAPLASAYRAFAPPESTMRSGGTA